jgi:hypothetical protein
MTVRPDISDKLIHFTRGATADDAFNRVRSIIGERRLIASNGMIKGGFRCVCFTEAPLPSLKGGFVNAEHFSRYSPFGIMFDKSWVFSRGGRPVIYQSEEEYYLLPEALKWRHVRYEPLSTSAIDFTWEREWRVHCEELTFGPKDAVIVLPNYQWTSLLRDIHDSEQDYIVSTYSTVFEYEIAEALREPFLWTVVTLE